MLLEEQNKNSIFSKQKKILSGLLSIVCLYLLILSVSTEHLILYVLPWILIIFVTWLVTNKIKIKINKLSRWWLIFVLYTWLITFASNLVNLNNYNASTSLKNISIYLIAFISIIYITQFCDKKFFFRIIRNFLSICSILGMFEFITKIQFYQVIITSPFSKRIFQTLGVVSSPQYRMVLFFANPIYFAVCMNLLLLMLLFIPFKNRVFNIFIFLMAIFCLILTQSRSGWISFFAIGILYLIKVKKFKKFSIKSVGLTLISIFVLSLIIYFIGKMDANFFDKLNSIFWSRTNLIFNSPDRGSGARLANLTLIDYVQNSFEKIFGGGNGFALSLLADHPSVDGWTSAVDNQYLTFIIDYGWIGIGIIGIYIFKCLVYLRKEINSINIMILLSILLIFCSSFFFEFYIQMYLNYFLLILIAFFDVRD